MKQFIFLAFILIGLITQSSAQNALDFDGNDDYVQTDYAGVLNTNNRTFEAWAYISTDAPTTNLAIIDYGLNQAGSRNTFNVSGLRELRYTSGGTNANFTTPENVVPVGEWVHLAFVLENGMGFLYVNSTLMGSGNLSNVDTPDGNIDVRIGQRVNGGNIPFHGILDEIRIWDVARTPAEIEINMNAELCSQHPNLKLYLKLNEGIAAGDNPTVTTAADDSGNDYQATLNDINLTGATSNWVEGAGIGTGYSTSFLEETACDSIASPSNTSVYTSSGIYTEVLSGGNVQGCDSIITLDLTILNSTSTNEVVTACNSYTWTDGNTYTASEIITYQLSNAAGCDSTIILDLTINEIDLTFSQTGSLLTANQIGAEYQWLDCPTMTPIPGATNQSYSLSTDGSYAVMVTTELCSDTSDCFDLSIVGTVDNEFGDDLLVFPNPTDGDFSIDMGESYDAITITIKDLTGKLIQSNTYENRQQLNLSLRQASGVYLLIIESENKKAAIRLVKE